MRLLVEVIALLVIGAIVASIAIHARFGSKGELVDELNHFRFEPERGPEVRQVGSPENFGARVQLQSRYTIGRRRSSDWPIL